MKSTTSTIFMSTTSVVLCILGLVGCDHASSNKDSLPGNSDLDTATETNDESSSESETLSRGTESVTGDIGTSTEDTGVESGSESATSATESQTQDTVTASCDDLEDCEWQRDDCVDFTEPSAQECLTLVQCGGTKLATKEEACAIQCPSAECVIVQEIAWADCDPDVWDCKDECAGPGEPRCP